MFCSISSPISTFTSSKLSSFESFYPLTGLNLNELESESERTGLASLGTASHSTSEKEKAL